MTDLPQDLRNYIPGRGYFAPPPAEEPEWKTNPRFHQEFVFNGKPTKLYTIGALASALGKQTVTIRKWIRRGVIPEAGLKTKAIEGTLGNAGRRLFTEEQIEHMIRLAKECGLYGVDRRVSSFQDSNFSTRVWALWRAKNW